MPTANSGGRKLKNDIILIASLVLAILILFLFWFSLKRDAETVTVTVNKEIYGVYSIGTDATIDIITGENNNQINRLAIKDGKAYIEYATCPDGICVSHRAISQTGESIICLPNKIVVSTTSNKSEVKPDIVA